MDATLSPPRAVRATALRWLPHVAFLALALGALARLGEFLPDDAFIHYRYARNLAAGEGWAYNPGEVSNAGATSPLWVMLLAAGAKVLGSVPRAADVWFVVSFTVAGGATAEALRRAGRSGAGVAAGLLVVTAPLLLATRGMESPLFLALTALSLWAVAARRPVGAGVALALLTLTRGDGLVVAALALAWWVWRERAFPWRGAAAFVALVGAWLAYAWVTFDDPVPGTLTAKVAQGDSGLWGEGELFVRGLWELPEAFRMGAWTALAAGTGVVGLASLVPSGRDARALVATLVGAAALLVVAYGPVLGVPAYHWYYALPTYAVIVLAGLAVGWLVRTGSLVPATIAVGASVALVVMGLRASPSGFPTPHYVAAAEFVEARAAPDATVAITEIGAFGWYAEDQPVIDYLGLLSEEVARHLGERDLAWWLGALEPDWWVVHDPAWSFELPAMRSPAFAAYERVPDDLAQLDFYRRR